MTWYWVRLFLLSLGLAVLGYYAHWVFLLPPLFLILRALLGYLLPPAEPRPTRPPNEYERMLLGLGEYR